MQILSLLKDFEYKIHNRREQDLENINITTVCIDSRDIVKDSLFICIKGLTVDGHNYIQDAISSGAAAVIISNISSIDKFKNNDILFIEVNNTKKVLSIVAANYYDNPADDLSIIAVTGTNGKTSVTYFMEAILKEYGSKTGVIGTIDTRIGDTHVNVYYATSTTPDTLELQKIFSFMKKDGVQTVIMEVSSHALELYKVYGINFKIGIFTNLTQDHLDFHKDMENYRNMKAKLFANSDFSIINIDDKYADYMLFNKKNRAVTYSIDVPSDFQAFNIEYSNEYIKFDINVRGDVKTFKAPIPGKFTVYNALSVIASSLIMDIPINIIQKGLRNIEGVPGRIQRVPSNKEFSVFIDYAHTPDSIENIINAVRNFTEGRVIIVFGCGGDRDISKRPVMGEIAGKLSDFCVITSDNPRTENPSLILNDIESGIVKTNCEYIKIVDRKEAINFSIKMAKPNDSIIIAGKGHENYQIFSDCTVHFDDFEEATKALDNL
jgi:UDP-N-acetylmuramyl-tripeptide synthetase